jgi:hypothetical protein
MAKPRVYFVEAFSPPGGDGMECRVHRDLYQKDDLSPDLIALVRVIAFNSRDALARVVSGRLGATGKYLMGEPPAYDVQRRVQALSTLLPALATAAQARASETAAVGQLVAAAGRGA